MPPPPAGVVVSLPLVDSVEIPGGFRIGVTGGSPLAEVWGSARTLATYDGIVRYVLLMRTGDSAFSALSATCTHEGCLVSGVDRPIFVCPCHGSRYDHTGAVVKGPAPAALPRYGTEYADGVLVVRF